MIAEKVRGLRENMGLTQSALAKQLGITRSCVNAWEMGISTPSTQYIVELSKIFDVSTDYILGVEKTSTLSLEGLDEQDIKFVHSVVEYIRNKK